MRMTTIEKIRAEIDNECKKYDRVGAICCGLNVAIAIIDKYAEQEPCDDAICREELLKAIDTWDKFGCNADTKLVPYQDHYIPYIHYDDVVKCIKGMPSVRPQEQTGHWKRISMDRYTTHAQYWYECDKCGEHNLGNTDFCPNCGAKMVEQKETETWHGIHAQITAPKGTFERIFNEADDDYDI